MWVEASLAVAQADRLVHKRLGETAKAKKFFDYEFRAKFCSFFSSNYSFQFD